MPKASQSYLARSADEWAGIVVRYSAELDRLRAVLETAVEELSREREDGTWTGSLTELDDLTADFIEAAKAALNG